jgi:hypothetical protein
VKQLIISARYFQAYDLKNRVKHKLLTLVEISEETVDVILMQVMTSIANYDIGGGGAEKEYRKCVSNY